MSRHLPIVIFSLAICLALTSTIAENTPTPCDYIRLLDDYDFDILNCTFTSQNGNALLDIFYKVTRDGSRANQIRYVLIDGEFNKKETIQKLQPETHQKGQIVKGQYLMQRKYIVQNWAVSVRVFGSGTFKSVISIRNIPIPASQNNERKSSNLVTVPQ